MTLVRAQVTLPMVSGLSQDVVVNTFYFESGAPGLTSATGTEIVARLQAGYDAVSSWFSAQLSRTFGGVTIKLFDMNDPEPRPPFLPGWGITLQPAATTTSLPREIALCLSYTSVLTGTTTGRTRGRVYLGPFVSTATAAGAGGDVPRPSAGLITDVTDMATALDTTILEAGVVWMVYSPTAATSTPVLRAWCDNEWDIQRRRGARATSRTEVFT